jgi:hypothetical protein
VELKPHHEAYYWFLGQMWEAGKSFLLVEQDIEVHASVPKVVYCPEPWCVFGYTQGGDQFFYHCLGCVRFSAKLIGALPNAISDLPVRHWRRLDAELIPYLLRAGYTPHIHEPPVLQHHVYNGRCACLQDHEDYPVDNEGRYCP